MVCIEGGSIRCLQKKELGKILESGIPDVTSQSGLAS